MITSNSSEPLFVSFFKPNAFEYFSLKHITKSVTILESETRLLLNLLLDTALRLSFFVLLHWNGKMLEDMEHIIKSVEHESITLYSDNILITYTIS